jgi:integrase
MKKSEGRGHGPVGDGVRAEKAQLNQVVAPGNPLPGKAATRKVATRLSQSVVNSFEPGPAKVRFADHEVKGLYLRVTPGGAKSYVLRYSIGTKRGEAVIGDARAITLADARKKALEMQAGIAMRGADPLVERAAARREAERRAINTIDALLGDYLADSDRRKRPRTMVNERYLLRRYVLPRFGVQPLETIRRAEIIAFVQDVGARSGATAANRAHAMLRQLLSFALQRELIEANPALSLRKIFKEESRDRVLSAAELKALWGFLEAARAGARNGISSPVAIALQLCLLTLQRSGEVVGAAAEEFDWEARTWSVPAGRMKGRRIHVVPLSELAVERFRQAFTASGDRHAFLNLSKTGPLEQPRLTRAMGRACSSLAIPSAGPHDLRRTGRTLLTSEKVGVSYETAERVIGHLVGSAVSRVYDRNEYLKEKRAALEAWSAELCRIVGA